MLDLSERKALLRRDREVQRASASGRHKESDVQMKGYASAFRTVLERDMPTVPVENRIRGPSLPRAHSRKFHNAVAR